MFVYGMTVYVENLKDCMCRKSQGIYKKKKKKEKIERYFKLIFIKKMRE